MWRGRAAEGARSRRIWPALWLALAAAVVVIAINEIGQGRATQTLQTLSERFERRLIVARLGRQMLEAESG